MDFLVENAIKGSDENKQEFEGLDVGPANIRVIGIGGAGNNMVGWLYNKGVKGAEIIACNTDQQHLNIINADRKFILGAGVTRGLGCGGFPEKGAEAAKESLQEVKQCLKESDMVFVCAGMGGGTGTGGAPIVAQVAKDTGSIVIGTVTMPFKIEKARVDKAEFGLEQLRDISDTVIVIDNNRLVNIAGNLPIQQAFAVANELIATMIKGIVETIAVPSLVNLDYADVKAIMRNGGVAAIGVAGLQLYKFGKTTSIPIENQNIEVPYDVLAQNQKNNLHTLFILDLKPNSNNSLSITDAIRYLLKVELKRNEKVFTDNTLCIGCAKLGSLYQIIRAGKAKELLQYIFKGGMHCLIVPAKKLHFMEEEALKLYY